ncbi:MAG: regulator of ime2 [Candelina mexicana]|nr:MAG: regulator of ime2 [Candelina mexicana]
MIRPATPLSVILFIAFAFCLLSTLSTPIIKAIPLATFAGVDFGVFGYCQGTKCGSAKIGYNIPDSLFGNNRDADFSLPPSARHPLTSILIVHPIAALLTLVLLILSLTAHLHSPSHSGRYLLILLILTIPTLLITLLAFLVDILLFTPHLGWGGWIVLAATILIFSSFIVTCAMRRTLVGRKARKKRIAENAEMSGENYYHRTEGARAETPPPLSAQPTAPMVNGAPGADKLPAFATFEVSQKSRPSHDDQIPLNPRTPSTRTGNSTAGGMTGSTAVDDGRDRYEVPGRMGPSPGAGRGYNGPRDEFGNPLPLSAAFGPPSGLRRDPSDPRIRNEYANGSLRSAGSGGPPPPFGGRGRGGYPPRGGFGRGGPHGNYRGQPPQGFNDNDHGPGFIGVASGAEAGIAMGETMGRGQRGPPPGYQNEYDGSSPGSGGPNEYGRQQSPAQYGAVGAYGRRPSPGPPSAPGFRRGQSPGPPSAPGYQDRRSPGPPSASGYGRRQSPGPPSAPGYQRGPSPGPPSGPGSRRGPSPGLAGYRGPSPGLPSNPRNIGYGGREPSPGPPIGATGVMRPRSESPPPPMPVMYPDEGPVGQAIEMDATTGTTSPTPRIYDTTHLRSDDGVAQGLSRQASPLRHDSSGPMSPTSVYSSQDAYVPPRAGWSAEGRTNTPPSNSHQQPEPIHTSPVELPTQSHSPHIPQTQAPSHQRNTSENYYEDVDPRFVDPAPVPNPPQQPELPNSLMPGQYAPYRGNSPGQDYLGNPEGNRSYEDIQERARSPAPSDGSHFTSVSQRGVNPNWRPQQGGPPPPGQYGPPNMQQQQQYMGGAMVPNRRPVQGQQRDVLLGGNPDFEIPGVTMGRGSGGPGRGVRTPGQIPGLQTERGRYPTDI